MSKEESRPTQEFVEIDSVQNGIVVLKNGGLRQILMVSGINIDLKSEEEQQLIASAYQNFLNSLRFSLQIFVHSRRLNIESYLGKLQARKTEETNELLQNQIGEYVEFIRSFVGENAIMDKNFFVVVPFDPMNIPGAGTQTGKKILGLFGGSKLATATAEDRERLMRENMEQLSQRVNQVVSGLAQIGLRVVPLQDDEVTDLFYNLYNPEEKERAGIIKQAT